MLLTAKLLQKLKAIVQKHHAAFVASAFGEDLIPEEQLAGLKKDGLIDPDASVSGEDAYLYGRVLAILENPAVQKWTPEQLEAWVAKNPVHLTAAEKSAVQAAKLTGAAYVQGLGNVVEKQTGQLLIEADSKLRADLQGKIVDATTANILKRETVKQLKSDLGWSTKDWTRDLDRIAITEKHNAMEAGVADGIRAKAGGDARVAIIPMPDVCPHCKKLHLGPDGAPRIFKLSQLAPPGANVKKKPVDWVACIGAVHPHCQCRLVRVPTGWGFDEGGNLVPGGKYGVEAAEDFQKALWLEDEHMDALRKAYKLAGKMVFQGLPISIEQNKGDTRFWKDRNGEEGKTTMLWPYGYIRGTEGVDGDHVDVYVGPNPESTKVFIVRQKKKLKDGEFAGYDEDKCMLGFSNEDEAKRAYLAHYNDPGFFGGMATVSMTDFKAQLEKKHGKSLTSELAKAGPFIGPRGGKWADAAHTVPWSPGSPEHTQALVQKLRDEHGVALDVSHHKNMLELSRIVVPESARGKGVGSKVMGELTAHADKHGLTMALSPSSDFGGSKSRLVEFYSGFEFKPNKGKHKDFTTKESMVRQPRLTKAHVILGKALNTDNSAATVSSAVGGATIESDRGPVSGSGVNLQVQPGEQTRPVGGVNDGAGYALVLKEGMPRTTVLRRDPRIYEMDADMDWVNPVNLENGVMASAHDAPEDDVQNREDVERLTLQTTLVPRNLANPGWQPQGSVRLEDMEPREEVQKGEAGTFLAFLKGDLSKAVAHKYVKKTWAHGHWVYEYAQKLGGSLEVHPSNEEKVALKVPAEHVDKLNKLKAIIQSKAPVLSSKAHAYLPLTVSEAVVAGKHLGGEHWKEKLDAAPVGQKVVLIGSGWGAPGEVITKQPDGKWADSDGMSGSSHVYANVSGHEGGPHLKLLGGDGWTSGPVSKNDAATVFSEENMEAYPNGTKIYLPFEAGQSAVYTKTAQGWVTTAAGPNDEPQTNFGLGQALTHLVGVVGSYKAEIHFPAGTTQASPGKLITPGSAQEVFGKLDSYPLGTKVHVSGHSIGPITYTKVAGGWQSSNAGNTAPAITSAVVASNLTHMVGVAQTHTATIEIPENAAPAPEPVAQKPETPPAAPETPPPPPAESPPKMDESAWHKVATELGGTITPHHDLSKPVSLLKVPKNKMAELKAVAAKYGLPSPWVGASNAMTMIPKTAPAVPAAPVAAGPSQLKETLVHTDVKTIPNNPHTKVLAKGTEVTIPSGGKAKFMGYNYAGEPVVAGTGTPQVVSGFIGASQSQYAEHPAKALSSGKVLEPTAIHKELVKEVLSEKIAKAGGATPMDYANWFRKKGHDVFLVGGIVRDMLYGTATGKSKKEILDSMKDVDFVTTSDPSVLNKCHQALAPMGGHKGDSFVAKKGFIPSPATVDLASLANKGNSRAGASYNSFDHDIESDAHRRDFTANALYYDVHNDKIIDPTGVGVADAQNRVLRRLPSDEWQQDDRIALRFWKFRARDWTGDPETTKAVIALAEKFWSMDPSNAAYEMGRQISKNHKDPEQCIAQLEKVMKEDGAGALWSKYMLPNKQMILNGIHKHKKAVEG